MAVKLRILVGTLCGFLAIGATAATQAQTTTLRQVGFRVLYLAPVFVAPEHGFFRDHGIDLTFSEIDSGALGPAAVLSGEAQISGEDVEDLAPLQKQGKSPLMFYNLIDRITADLVLRTDVVKRIGIDPHGPILDRAKSLKGLTLGITRPGAPTDTYTRYFLVMAGLDPDRDASIVQVGGVPALDAAFRSGRIDGFMLTPPLPQTLEQAGLGIILIRNTAGEVPAFADTTYVGLFTTAEFARTHRDVLIAYTTAMREAVAWMAQQPAEAAKLLETTWFKDASPGTVAMSLDAMMPTFSTTGRFSRAGLQKYVDVFKSVGDKTEVDLTEGVMWTNEYLK